jgi:hypothetical protein
MPSLEDFRLVLLNWLGKDPGNPYASALSGLPVSVPYQERTLRQYQLAEAHRNGKRGGVNGLAKYAAQLEYELRVVRDENAQLRVAGKARR